MRKYYTRPCNFSYNNPRTLSKNKYNLNGNNYIYFDSVEIISRTSIKKVKVNKINYLSPVLKKKIKLDLKNITSKKKFKNLNFSKTPLLMGVLNVTPDSFSDGGKYLQVSKSLSYVRKLSKQGCDIIDIGAESTRPGSKEVDKFTEWKRLKKHLRKLSRINLFKSLDTRKSFIMEKALKYKINLINDVSGLNYDKKTLKFLKKTNIPFVIHHMQGIPQNMQNNPKYNNALLDIYDFFEDTLKKIRSAGIKHNNILLDPGIGFGKKLKHNITILKNISIFHSLGFPLLLGISRKKFINELSGINDSQYRYGGTISTSLYLMKQGVQILRVHDVNEVKQAIKIYQNLNL